MNVKPVINPDYIITDEHTSCSYGVPVVVKDGIAYGNSDVISIDPHDSANVLTARRHKIVTAKHLYARDKKMYSWIVRGTGHIWADHVREYNAAILANNGMFAHKELLAL